MHSAVRASGRVNEVHGSGRPGGPLRRALVALLVAGVAVACGPATDKGPADPAPPPTASASVTPTPEASPTPSPSPTPSAGSATPTPPPPPPSPTVASDAKAYETPAPAPSRTAPAPAPKSTTKAPAEPATADCEIVSNAGNCYNAGQFCRDADVGRSTHAGNGRMIHCRPDGSRARWGY
ncbi:hypothetical protein AB0P15_12640 [Streptomyces sp. NPDC087917]|uniref:hypothetical protein n=1 Tax=Streptomyces sp. NPDC087917 TaxID=3155060 RepID=UPI00343481CD